MRAQKSSVDDPCSARRADAVSDAKAGGDPKSRHGRGEPAACPLGPATTSYTRSLVLGGAKLIGSMDLHEEPTTSLEVRDSEAQPASRAAGGAICFPRLRQSRRLPNGVGRVSRCRALGPVLPCRVRCPMLCGATFMGEIYLLYGWRTVTSMCSCRAHRSWPNAGSPSG
jgi:hypothetical protein